jgi:hypothetical protein
VKKSIAIPIYGGRVRVHVTDDMEKTLDEVGYSSDLFCDACVLYSTDDSAYDLILKRGSVQHGLIAHECFHLTMRIMRGVNKKYDIENDEPEAYLMQFLVTEVYSALRENKVQVK